MKKMIFYMMLALISAIIFSIILPFTLLYPDRFLTSTQNLLTMIRGLSAILLIVNICLGFYEARLKTSLHIVNKLIM